MGKWVEHSRECLLDFLPNSFEDTLEKLYNFTEWDVKRELDFGHVKVDLENGEVDHQAEVEVDVDGEFNVAQTPLALAVDRADAQLVLLHDGLVHLRSLEVKGGGV